MEVYGTDIKQRHQRSVTQGREENICFPRKWIHWDFCNQQSWSSMRMWLELSSSLSCIFLWLKSQCFFYLFAGEDSEFLMKTSVESGGKERELGLNVKYHAPPKVRFPCTWFTCRCDGQAESSSIVLAVLRPCSCSILLVQICLGPYFVFMHLRFGYGGGLQGARQKRCLLLLGAAGTCRDLFSQHALQVRSLLARFHLKSTHSIS